MRVSFLQGYNQGIKDIIRISDQTYNTQQQVSSGQRIVKPSDDPVAAAQLLQLNQVRAQLEQFNDNASIAENRLQTEEVRLNSINNILVRIKEITIQAANFGAYDQLSRQALAAEVESRLDELVDLANAQDANGEYVFSGFQGDTEPFTKNTNGSYTYNGDDGQRTVKVASGTEIALSDSGKQIFENIPSAQNRAVSSVITSAAGKISQPVITNQTNYDTNSYPNDYIIEFTTATDYEIQDEAGVAITTGTLAAVPGTINFEVGTASALNMGFEVEISGTVAIGDTFKIDSSSKQSIMTTLQLLADGLNDLTDSTYNSAESAVALSTTGSISQPVITNQSNFDRDSFPSGYVINMTTATNYEVKDDAGVLIDTGTYTPPATTIDLESTNGLGFEFTLSDTGAGLTAGDEFRVNPLPSDIVELEALVNDSLTNIASAEDNIISSTSILGARLNTVDSARALNEGVLLVNEEIISELSDLDYAEAVSRLSVETFVLEAAQQTFTKVTGLSLFNFL